MQAATYAKSAEIRSRIEPDLKQKSTEVLAELGLDLSGAIRLFPDFKNSSSILETIEIAPAAQTGLPPKVEP